LGSLSRELREVSEFERAFRIGISAQIVVGNYGLRVLSLGTGPGDDQCVWRQAVRVITADR